MSLDNMQQTHFFAVDLGATSGRTILGSVGKEGIEIQELTRFPNYIIEVNKHFYWDLYALFNEIIKGLKVLKRENKKITSIGIDTWGVDFVCIAKDGEMLRQPYCYRDPHTNCAPEEFFKKVSKEDVYKRTGIQIMNFNSLFQLYTLQKNNTSVLSITDKILFIPDALSYMLTDNMITEYTIASTSQLIDPYEKRFIPELLNKVGLQEDVFSKLVYPGTEIGSISEEVRKQTGLEEIKVIAVAGHDTASAIAAIPTITKNFAYLSSGTWSLMGVELEEPIITEESARLNFTNEGGIDGTMRFLKNICGMWLLECCRREWNSEEDCSYTDLIEEALTVPEFQSLINPDTPCFANPVSMISAIQEYCRKTQQTVPMNKGELTRCIFESLAFRYRQVLESLQSLIPFQIEILHVIGGGSKNNLLNMFTANATGLPVIAGPSEATAIGNIMLQAKAAGVVSDIKEMRKLIADSVSLQTFFPTDGEVWEEGYTIYKNIYREHI